MEEMSELASGVLWGHLYFYSSIQLCYLFFFALFYAIIQHSEPHQAAACMVTRLSQERWQFEKAVAVASFNKDMVSLRHVLGNGLFHLIYIAELPEVTIDVVKLLSHEPDILDIVFYEEIHHFLVFLS